MAEIVGDTGCAHHYIKIQYCGGWGYRPHCTKTIDQLNAMMPDNHFQFQLFMDQGTTGNFEITVFTTADLSDEGKPVYSKQATGKFPHASADEFEVLVNAITAAT